MSHELEPASMFDLEVPAGSGQLPDRVDILVVATEWEPRHGGISTFNRNLCTALAQLPGCRVVCYVPAQDGQVPENCDGVEVLPAEHVVGLRKDDSAHLLCKPNFSRLTKHTAPDFAPEFIIGHDDKSGPHALYLALVLPTAERQLEPTAYCLTAGCYRR